MTHESHRQIRIGTSGWRYPEWRHDYYPRGLAQRAELSYVASRLGSIEINGTFYSLQRPALFRRWFDEVPDDFTFALKGSRFITHMKKLNDVRAPLANFFASGLLALGKKLGPFLWQFPKGMPLDDRFETFFALLPKSTDDAARLARRHDSRVSHRSVLRSPVSMPLQHVVEIRDVCDSRFIDRLRRHGIGLVLADTAGRFPALEAVTARLMYVRLHGEAELYGGGYSKESIRRWGARVREWATTRDVYVYFDNDRHGRAPYDAEALASEVGVSRTSPAQPLALSPARLKQLAALDRRHLASEAASWPGAGAEVHGVGR